MYCDQVLLNRLPSKDSIINKVFYDKTDNSLWIDVTGGGTAIMIDNDAPYPLSNEYMISLPSYFWIPAKITDSRVVNSNSNNNSKLIDVLLNIKGVIKVSIDITRFYIEFKNRLKSICNGYKNQDPKSNVIDCDKYFNSNIDGNNDMPYLKIVNSKIFYDMYVNLDSPFVGKYGTGEKQNANIFQRLSLVKENNGKDVFGKWICQFLEANNVALVCREWNHAYTENVNDMHIDTT